MTELVTGTILFNCKNARSNKDYILEVYRMAGDAFGGKQMMRCKFGPAGRVSQQKEYGDFSIFAAEKHLATKIAKGYEIVTVNDKPFASGNLFDALTIVAKGNGWEETTTAQPHRKIKAVDVVVTYDPGQISPLW